MSLKCSICSIALFSLATAGAFAEEPLADVSKMVAVSEPDVKSSCPLHPKDQFFRSETAIQTGINTKSIAVAGKVQEFVSGPGYEDATGPVVGVYQQFSLAGFFLRLQGEGSWSMTSRLPGLYVDVLGPTFYRTSSTGYSGHAHLGKEFFLKNGFLSLKPYVGFGAYWHRSTVKGFGGEDSPDRFFYKFRLYAPMAGFGAALYPTSNTFIELNIGVAFPHGFVKLSDIPDFIYEIDRDNRLGNARHGLTASVRAKQKLSKYLSGTAGIDFYSLQVNGQYIGLEDIDEHHARATAMVQSVSFTAGLALVF